MMKKLLVNPGIDPDSIAPAIAPASGLDLMEVDSAASTRKRLPSGSPEGKNCDTSESESYDDTIDAMEEESCNITMLEMAITLVKGHEPTRYETPECYCWSFLKFYYVIMKGPNKQLSSKKIPQRFSSYHTA